MRSSISLFLLALSLTITAQRVEFNDPDLDFSLKKPKNWELIDNGYVVKISPTLEDTATTFFTITYFEPPSSGFSSSSDFPQAVPANSLEIEKESDDKNILIIADEPASWTKSEVEEGIQILTIKNYRFKKLGQDWEIITACPMSEERSLRKVFRKIIKSLRVSN